MLAKGLQWEAAAIERFVSLLVEVAGHSGGGAVDPPATVGDCPDREDNRILDLAAEVGALLIVSDDVDLTGMQPWRRTPVLRPRESVAKVDGMRRHRRRR